MGQDFFYSPHIRNCPSISAETELFPELNSSLDFTLEDFKDKPASTWSINRIGVLQSRLQKANLSRHKINLHELLSICNDVFGYDGWRTELIDLELTNYEETITGDDGEEDGDGDEDVVLSEQELVLYDDNGLVILDASPSKLTYTLEVTTRVRLILKDKTYHEAVGVGRCYNMPIKLMLFIKCKKESYTNGIKKAVLEMRDMLLAYEMKRDSGYYV